MKIDNKSSKQIETNSIDLGEVLTFTLKSPGKIMAVFRDNMYKHKFRTMVQEYMCNARDGVRERLFNKLRAENKVTGKDVSNLEKIEEYYALESKHLEVWVPTTLDQFFRVRDYGVGISPNRMREVFVDLGSSTKDENYSTGGFGFGGKIGFAVSDSFSITSWVDGKKYEYLATLANNSDGEIIPLGVSDSSEPNGVMIEVPVGLDQIELVKSSILRTCLFWKTKPVIHNYEELNPSWFKFTEVFSTPTSKLVSLLAPSGFAPIHEKILANKTDKFFILIDDIVYPITNNLLLNEGGIKLSSLIKNDICVLLRANIGVLDIIANREEIAINDKNNKIINEMFHKLVTDYTKELEQKIENSKDINELILNSIEVGNNSKLLQMKKDPKSGQLRLNDKITAYVDSSGSIRVWSKLTNLSFNKEHRNNDLGYCVCKFNYTVGGFSQWVEMGLDTIHFYTNNNNYEEGKIRGIATNLIRYQKAKYVVILCAEMLGYATFFKAKDISDVVLVKPEIDDEAETISRKKPRKEIIEYRPYNLHNSGYSQSKTTKSLGDFTEELVVYTTPSTPMAITVDTLKCSVRDLVFDVMRNNTRNRSFVFIDNAKSLERIKKDNRFIDAIDFLRKVQTYFSFDYTIATHVARQIQSKLVNGNYQFNKNIVKVMNSIQNKDMTDYFRLHSELLTEIANLNSEFPLTKIDKAEFWFKYLQKEKEIDKKIANLSKKYANIDKIANKYSLLGLVNNENTDAEVQIKYSNELGKYVESIFSLDKQPKK